MAKFTHHCEGYVQDEYSTSSGEPLWGSDRWDCFEVQDRELSLVINKQEGIQVNFCPFCGYEGRTHASNATVQ
jgi:hypothetical protein